MEMIKTEPVQDNALLHFLKELPAWVILTVMIIIFLVYYHFAREDFVPRIIDGLVGALLTAIVGQAGRKTGTTISADTVQTPNLNTESMPDATINTGTIQSNSDLSEAGSIDLGPNNQMEISDETVDKES